MTGVVMLMVFVSIILLYRYLFASTFQPTIALTMGIPVRFIHYYLMLLLSFAVVAAMQTVGVILVVALLITPASTALLITNKLRRVLILASLTGFLSSLSGLIISILYEMPPGPAIAVMATVIYLLAALLSPEHGLIAKGIRKRRQIQKIRQEDILKEAFKLSFSEHTDIRTMAEKLGVTKHRIRKMMDALSGRRLIEKRKDDRIVLTESGRAQANQLIRAHRLWESYLVTEMGMDASQIHAEAEQYEHILTSDQIDAVDRQLGFPALDPHGSPIPANEKIPTLAMSTLGPSDKGTISQRQPGADITFHLWRLGLGPEDGFEVVQTGQPFIIRVKNEQIEVPQDLAGKVSVQKDE